MTDKKARTMISHTRWLFLILFVVFAVLFCIFPSQMWMIPIFAVSLVGFTVFNIWNSQYKPKYEEKGK